MKAIFTVNLNNYDTLKQPPKWEGFETVLITDGEPDKRFDRVIQVKSDNPYLDSRYYKWLSHVWGAEYESVVYYDANLQIVKPMPWEVFFIQHPKRRTVLEECKALINLKHRYEPKDIISQYNWMLNKGFKDKYGLYQNGFFGRRHDAKNNKIADLVFDVCKAKTNRDQLALPYALWRLNARLDNVVRPDYFRSHVIRPQHAKQHPILTNQPIEETPIQTRANVHHITPARLDKNFGKAINQLIEHLPENDWICLRDIDTFPPYHEEFIKQIEDLANGNQGFDLIGCMTNRLGLAYQLVPDMFNEYDTTKHREIAKQISDKPKIKPLTKLQSVGGVMMLFSKKTWLRAGKFPEGGISIKGQFVDYHFSKAVSKFGRLGIAEHVYLYHNYRIDHKITSSKEAKEHLL